MTQYLLGAKMRGVKKPPLVLMLEPLFACNLRCEGCGRIREYAAYTQEQLSVSECLEAAQDCGAPVVSICGGEPLLYRELERLLAGFIQQRRFIYLCTNGLLIDRWLERLPVSPYLTLNVHLDGMETTHDRITGRPGTFRHVTRNIALAKQRGIRVTTNTTIYAQTDMHEILVLLEYLMELRVDGMLLSPAYPYESVVKCGSQVSPQTWSDQGGVGDESSDTSGREPLLSAYKDSSGNAGQGDSQEDLFLDREMIWKKFASISRHVKRFPIINSPLYLDFLEGRRDLPCAAWASPTRNVCGWKSPCYLLTDTHYRTFREWREETPWEKLGPGRDPRCQDCLVHYGFEPAAVFAAQRSLRDSLALARWQLAGRGR